MLSTSDFRKGLRLKIDNDPYYIVDFQHARTAQRRANVWTKLKNIKTGAVIERTFPAGEQFEQPDFQEKIMQYMYSSGGEYHFMDTHNYEQIALSQEQLGDYKWYLVVGREYKILFFEGNPVNLDIPTSVILQVITTGPGVKGDTVTNITKEASLETGLPVKVPLFIKEGDFVKVDTRTGEYIERVQGREG